LALDQIQWLLAFVGERNLDAGMGKDSAGTVRLLYPSRTWEEFVTLAVTEIRRYGGPNPQVMRRMQAMYDYLMQVLPEARKDAIRNEIGLLRQTLEQCYESSQDLELAASADFLGFGACRTKNYAKDLPA
jgi:uncharacterized membrane protein